MGWRGILGFEYGIVQAPLGPDISGPELVAAVANTGAIGLLRAPDWEAPNYLRNLIRKTRLLTNKPFGVAIVLAFPHEENLKIGSYEEAEKAKEAGVDGIIVQGIEAGGHVIGKKGLMVLVPRVVDLVSDCEIAVIAAGGIVEERGYVAALALGAHGVCLGTRFLATEESFAHPLYKRKMIEVEETKYTDVFGRARWPGAPHRVLVTPFFGQWRNLPEELTEENQPIIGHSIIHGMPKEIRRFAGTVPNATTTGDLENMVMYAGQGVGLVKDIIPACQVVKKLVEGAQNIIKQNILEAGII